jgi:hypothetical protein
MISNSDAAFPKWSTDGKYLFYVSKLGALIAVDVLAVPGVTSFQWQPASLQIGDFPFRGWDIDQNNRFFYLPVPPSVGPTPLITVVLNWMEHLKK